MGYPAHAMIAPRPELETRMSTIALLYALSASSSPAADPATIAAIEATCHDYVDGQLEADPQRVARSLHPDLAKRAVLGDTPDERLGLRRMSKEELVSLTKQGALKTPKDQWDRRCTVLDVTGNAASVRLETPWFVDYFHMGRFDQRWVIVNALWYPKPKAQ
ncbi:putative lumazine-binding protein [Stenotrophomonas sp. CC22-02]|nr:putative lumazine-binding protein [Stenotrophomonas sp. CC22-02]